MECPHCKTDTKCKTIETRQHRGRIYRMKECLSCGGKFPSLEEPFQGKMPPRDERHPLTGFHKRAFRAKPVVATVGQDLMAAWRRSPTT